MIPLRFGYNSAITAHQLWGFNCGPAAICAMLGLAPGEIHQHMHHPKRGDRSTNVRFEDVKYTSPTMMKCTLENLFIPFSRVTKFPVVGDGFGLMRVQFVGPWCNPGVPMPARYHATHWVGVDGDDVFDINALVLPHNGWIGKEEWQERILPVLMGEIEKCDNTCHPTHFMVMERPPESTNHKSNKANAPAANQKMRDTILSLSDLYK